MECVVRRDSYSACYLVKKSISKTEVGHGIGGPYLPCAEWGLHCCAINTIGAKIIIVEGIWMGKERGGFRLCMSHDSVCYDNYCVLQWVEPAKIIAIYLV